MGAARVHAYGTEGGVLRGETEKARRNTERGGGVLAWGACLVRGGEETAQTGGAGRGSEAEMSLRPLLAGRLTGASLWTSVSLISTMTPVVSEISIQPAPSSPKTSFFDSFFFLVVFYILTN